MYRNRLITLSLLGIFYACSSQTPTSEPQPPAPAPEVSSSEIVAYLKQQIEVSPIASPNSKFHEQNITPEQIPAKQDELWRLWQKANKERLNESRLNVALSADYKQDFIWKIPQGQQLKSRIFTKGVAPQGGYPLIINLHGGGRNPRATEPWGWDLNQTEWLEQIKWSTGYYMDAPSLGDNRLVLSLIVFRYPLLKEEGVTEDYQTQDESIITEALDFYRESFGN